MDSKWLDSILPCAVCTRYCFLLCAALMVNTRHFETCCINKLDLTWRPVYCVITRILLRSPKWTNQALQRCFTKHVTIQQDKDTFIFRCCLHPNYMWLNPELYKHTGYTNMWQYSQHFNHLNVAIWVDANSYYLFITFNNSTFYLLKIVD